MIVIIITNTNIIKINTKVNIIKLKSSISSVVPALLTVSPPFQGGVRGRLSQVPALNPT
jgi:hypothetical protein